jgi:predicted RNA-binding protein with PIN domain
MSRPADNVTAALLRGIGAFLKDTPAPELPAPLRRFRNFRSQSLTAHRDELVAALDDDALRARIAHWLDKDKPSLSRKDAELLSIAAHREDGWEEKLVAAIPRSSPPTRDPVASAAARLEAEKEKARKARDEARHAKEEGRAAVEAERGKRRAVEAELTETRARLNDAIRDAAVARRAADEATVRLEREQRRVKATLDKSAAETDEARRELKEARRTIRELERDTERARARPSVQKKNAARSSAPAKPRTRLPVPKGRLEDAPETLDAWLSNDDVILVVDGYNVAKAEGAFGDLPLEQQRDRLIDEVNRLARAKHVRTIVVFDGSKIAAGLARRARGPAQVEYSRPDEIADDHIVAKLEGLPQVPVVLVTNDKELQDRGRALGATVATSNQLLALIR